MSKDEALKLALDWYDSGREDRDEFEAMMKVLLAEQPASKPLPKDYAAMEQALTRLQKRYAADIEGKVGKPRQWRGLTNEELMDLTAIYSGAPLYCAIEAKLKERNA